VDQGIIEWILQLVERSLTRKVHIFSLDFASALLANILHASSTASYLEKNPMKTKLLMSKMLGILKDKIPTSVLMHLLICLSYLNREKYAKQAEECGF